MVRTSSRTVLMLCLLIGGVCCTEHKEYTEAAPDVIEDIDEPTELQAPPDITVEVSPVDTSDVSHDANTLKDIESDSDIPRAEDAQLDVIKRQDTNIATKDIDYSDAPTCDPVDTPKNDFELVMGKLISNKKFVTVEPYEEIEIVQGPQGGVHVEIAFRFTPGTEFSGVNKVKVVAQSTSYMDCCEEPEVGYFNLNKYLVYASEDSSSTFQSGVIPVIFSLNKAIHYLDQYCCVTLKVGARLPGENDATLWSTTQHTFYCVDYL